jgi:hypothetical protein
VSSDCKRALLVKTNKSVTHPLPGSILDQQVLVAPFSQIYLARTWLILS